MPRTIRLPPACPDNATLEPDGLVLIFTQFGPQSKREREFNWVLTHRDEFGIDESWRFAGTGKTLYGIWKAIDGKLLFREQFPTLFSPFLHPY